MVHASRSAATFAMELASSSYARCREELPRLLEVTAPLLSPRPPTSCEVVSTCAAVSTVAEGRTAAGRAEELLLRRDSASATRDLKRATCAAWSG